MGTITSVPIESCDVDGLILTMKKNIYKMKLICNQIIGLQPSVFQRLRYGEQRKECLAAYTCLVDILGENNELKKFLEIVNDLDATFYRKSLDKYERPQEEPLLST